MMKPEPCFGRSPDAAGRPEKHQVQQAFSAAAERYDHLAELQRRVADRLFAHLADADVAGGVWMDLGAGTGYCASRLSGLFPDARAIALDLAEGMLQQLRRSPDRRSPPGLVVGDAEALPLADCSVDLIVSSLALQWCPDPGRALRESARVLKPGGHLFFTTFGPDTLAELRAAWAEVDAYTHVNHFYDAAALLDGVSEYGLESLRTETETRVVRYSDVAELMRELKGLGAHNVTSGRPRGLLGPGALARMTAAYQAASATSDGGVRASFEVIYGVLKRRPR